jgi:hypothetical protein
MLQLGQDLLFAHDMIHLVMQLGLIPAPMGDPFGDPSGHLFGGDHVVPI